MLARCLSKHSMKGLLFSRQKYTFCESLNWPILSYHVLINVHKFNWKLIFYTGKGRRIGVQVVEFFTTIHGWNALHQNTHHQDKVHIFTCGRCLTWFLVAVLHSENRAGFSPATRCTASSRSLVRRCERRSNSHTQWPHWGGRERAEDKLWHLHQHNTLFTGVFNLNLLRLKTKFYILSC